MFPFDPAGVWPMVDDRDVVRMPKGLRALMLSIQFSQVF